MGNDSRVRVAVVGGGITGLAAAGWLQSDHGIDDLVVLESSDRSGGKIRSQRTDGHLLEWGPQGFLDSAPNTLELADVVGIGDRATRADEAAAARFIVRGGRLRRVPSAPPAFMTSGLLPPMGMLRVMLEPFAKRHPGGDETVFDFAARRIGRHAAEVLVDAMVTGVFAGDSRQLSLAATFPKMAAMEAEHGSLTRALVARMRAARRAGGRSAGPAGPGGTLTTFANGMEELPTALAARLGARLRLNASVRKVVPDGRIFRLETDSGSLEAEAVLLTVPARAAAGLLAPIAPAAREPLEAVATVPIAVIMTSYSEEAFGKPLEGFGFLVPRGEHLGILGTLFCHAIFPGQAPSGRAFLRTMVGGAREPEAAGLSDEELLSRVRAAHTRVLGADPEPADFWVVRWPEGISQYTVGHLQRVATAESAAHGVGIELAGSPYRGVSVNDCITQARAAAGRIAARLTSPSLGHGRLTTATSQPSPTPESTR